MATTLPAYCTPDLSSFLPGCAALSSVAGVRTFFYAARLTDLTITYGPDGSITGIALKAGGKLAKFDGVKFQNSGAFELTNSTFGKKRWKHTWNYRAFFRNQASRNTLQNMARIEDLVVIAPNNDNLIEVYGAQVGLSPASGKGGTGIKLDDDNTALFAFEGEEPGLPPLYNTVAVIATTASAGSTASTSLSVASATGIVAGQLVSATGVDYGTTVASISGTTVTLSAPATVSSGAAVSFTAPDTLAYATNLAALDTLVNA